jgi:nucleoside-diphosphate-sugar epimerase
VTVAVTGAAGFLGGAVAQALEARGDAVRRITRAQADVTDEAAMTRALAGACAVVHCAGMLGRAGVPEEAFQRVHVGGAIATLRAARALGVARVVLVSSPGLLGPIRGAPADEDAPPAPTNAYERSKAAAERAVHDFQREHGPHAIIVRPEFVYGPGDRHVLGLFRAIQRRRFFFIGDGSALCHPTYVDDAVRGILAALDRGIPGRIYHIAGPRPVSIRDLANVFAVALGVRPPRARVPERVVRVLVRALGRLSPLTESAVDFFTFDRQFSWDRAKNELGYVPGVEVEEGARRAVRWYEAQKLLRTNHMRPSIKELYGYAFAEGEGVGTAYEYYVKRRVMRSVLESAVEGARILVAGLPEKYGTSLDFILAAAERRAKVLVVDERPEAIRRARGAAEKLGLGAPEYRLLASMEEISLLPTQDVALSCEVVQRLAPAARSRYTRALLNLASHGVIFVPNSENRSHLEISGLAGLDRRTLAELVPGAIDVGYTDLPPFPPGISRSEEQRARASSGRIEATAMWGLQLYSAGEPWLPAALKRRVAHIVYAKW